MPPTTTVKPDPSDERFVQAELKGRRLGRALTKLGKVTREQVHQALALQQGGAKTHGEAADADALPNGRKEMPRFMDHDQAGQDGQGCENSHQAGGTRMGFILGGWPL